MATKQGPLSRIGAITRAIDLNIGRQLRWGKGIKLEFLVPDQDNLVTGLRLVFTMLKDFDRISNEETLNGDGRTVIYEVADKSKTGIVEQYMRLKDLHIRADGLTLKVSSIPILAPNESRVYIVTCSERTMKKTYFK